MPSINYLNYHGVWLFFLIFVRGFLTIHFLLFQFFYNIRDVMTDSFGEGYSTRSDEDGFGCIYSRDNDTVNHPGVILDLWFLSVLLTKIEYIYFEHFL